MSEYTDTVIDLSHWNVVNDGFKAACTQGLNAVIHKCTQGTGYADPMYVTQRNSAINHNLLWGAYHFLDSSDGAKQAEWFLKNCGSIDECLLCVDFEPEPNGKNARKKHIDVFIKHIQNECGRLPVIYTAAYYLNETGVSEEMKACEVWLAKYDQSPPDMTKGVLTNWDKWTLWQFTNGKHNVPETPYSGITRHDRNCFNGTENQLKAWWVAST